MKRRFNINRRYSKRNSVFLVLITGVIVFSLFAYLLQFPEMVNTFNSSYKNIDIVFFDQSFNRENPSGKVTIDGKEVYQVDSISKSLYHDIGVNLEEGKHIIEISTTDDKFKLIDTFEVVDYTSVYKLSITYHYNPPVNEYKRIVVERIFQEKLKEKNYTSDEKAELLKQVTEETNKWCEDDTIYQPGKCHFTFYLTDELMWLD